MASTDTRNIILSIVGVGVALAALNIQQTHRSDDLRNAAVARLDNSLSETKARFDTYLAESASDRRALQAAMDQFRTEMQRLAERQSHVEGALGPRP